MRAAQQFSVSVNPGVVKTKEKTLHDFHEEFELAEITQQSTSCWQKPESELLLLPFRLTDCSPLTNPYYASPVQPVLGTPPGVTSDRTRVVQSEGLLNLGMGSFVTLINTHPPAVIDTQ